VRARAGNLAAAIHFHAGRIPEAQQAVRRALALATDEGEERTGLAKLRSLADPEARRTLGRVLFGDTPTRGVDAGLTVYLITEFAAAASSEALAPYLLARQLVWRDPQLALIPLKVACPLGERPRGTPLETQFLRECRRMTGESAFRAGDLALSKSAYETLKKEADNEAEQLRADDFLERIAWEERRLAIEAKASPN
jgi:hypothetical protein